MKFLLIPILFCVIILLVAPIFVQANGVDPCESQDLICIDNPLKHDKIEDIIKAITTLLKTIAIPLGTIMVIWGGIQIMVGMSTGEKEKKVLEGKKTITWAVIGVAIIIGVDLIVGLVKELLAK